MGPTVLQVMLLMSMRGLGSRDQCSELGNQLPGPDRPLPRIHHSPADSSTAETLCMTLGLRVEIFL